jgi:hypothetical protein
MRNEYRDFKGVWIPKEIWLNTELSALDKIIYTEISSLDNENHCTASNEYLAQFCMCSERKVSDAIRKLLNMGLLEVVSFDGRRRKLRVAEISMKTSKKCESELQKILSNNIDNNIDNTSNISSDISNDISSDIPDKPVGSNNSGYNDLDTTQSEYESHMYGKDDFLGSAKRKTKPKKESLFSKCEKLNLSYCNNNSSVVLFELLDEYLKLRLQMKEKPIYGVNQWQGILDKLDTLAGADEKKKSEIVKQSIERGWASFFDLQSDKSTYKKKDVFSEGNGLSCERCETSTEERKEILRQQGRRTEF